MEWLEAFNDAVSQYLLASQQGPHWCQVLPPARTCVATVRLISARVYKKEGWCQLSRQPFTRGVTPEGRL